MQRCWLNVRCSVLSFLTQYVQRVKDTTDRRPDSFDSLTLFELRVYYVCMPIETDSIKSRRHWRTQDFILGV